MKRIVCWLRGHDWDIVTVNVRKNINLWHLHPMAGCQAFCRRCGSEWDDLWSPYFDDDLLVHPSRVTMPLPAARWRQ